MLPALPRLPNVRDLINKKRFFILHAPRQSGKTTVIKAAIDSLNNEGSYYALYCSLVFLLA
jgi:AAA+ ATPase superfamily predicted ATPase